MNLFEKTVVLDACCAGNIKTCEYCPAFDGGGCGISKRMLNLTPHDVVVYDKMGENVLYVIPASGVVARVIVEKKRIDRFGDAPVYKNVYGEVEGLPEEYRYGYCIVSSIVASRCPDRRDLVVPDDCVRDEKGRIVGCKGFAFV